MKQLVTYNLQPTTYNRKPLVSVIMPVYNAGDFLRQTIKSILDQSYTNFEILAVDDGSTDDSYEILQGFAKGDKRVRVFSYKYNRGLSFAANLAIKKAKGDFIARFDADDLMPKDRLGKQVNYLTANKDILAVGGQCLLIDDNDKIIGEKKFPLTDHEIKESGFYLMSLQAGSMMINRKKLPENFTYYNSKYRYAEDHELLFKLFQYGKVANLPDVLLFYRQHESNSIKQVNSKSVFKSICAIRFNAIKRGYQPSIRSFTICLLQLIIVNLIPEKLIPMVFAILRGTAQPLQVSKRYLQWNSIFPRFYQSVRNYLF